MAMKFFIWIKKVLTGFSLAGLILAGTGCGPRKTSITLAGSTAFQPFAEKLAEQYMAENPGIDITVQGGGSAVGIQSALSGAAQIGMADLVVLPEEARALTATVVARDGISIVVHPTNRIDNLSTQQVRNLFNGVIKNWKEIGGHDGTVTVVSREAGSGTRSSFEEIVQGIHLSGDAIIQDSNGTIRETVANDPNAIGYLSHGLLNERIKPLRVDGVNCSVETIKNRKYTLVRPVFLLTQGAPKGAAGDFIGYILSPAGQKTIENSGLIGVE
ncbi:MAG TPA: phosphate ABC transporter substrate-binding protein [bacterium]